MLLLWMIMPVSLLAQEVDYPSFNHRVITNGFLDNWFFSAGADWNAFYSDQEHGHALPKSPFGGDRNSVGLNVSLGKWITPSLALRFKVNGFRAKNVRISGDGNNEVDYPAYQLWTYELQPMLNLTNLFGGYKERLWNCSLYVGLGIANNRGGFAFPSCNTCTWVGTVGMLNTFNVSRRIYVNLDISASAAEAATDGFAVSTSPVMMKNRDCIVRFGVGVGVNLGKVGWKKGPDMDAVQSLNQAEVDALNATIMDLEMENEKLKNERK